MKDKTFSSILQLANRFKTDKDCRHYLAQKLWRGESPICPHCTNDAYSFSDGKRYKCKTCKKQFTITVGTIFEGSHIELQKWFIAIYILTAHKKGISSLQLGRDLDITQKSAWYMLHRIRYAIRSESFLAPLENVVELDETYVGGKEKNKHRSKRIGGTEGRSLDKKVPVFGMFERGGEVRTERVLNAKSQTLLPIIAKNVSSEAIVMTDEASSYRQLYRTHNHLKVNHKTGQYVNGTCHTNTIENYWSIFKRGIIGIYHQISPKHTDKYLDEFEFRFNSRKATEQNRFDSMLLKSEGYLSYKNLISKTK